MQAYAAFLPAHSAGGNAASAAHCQPALPAAAQSCIPYPGSWPITATVQALAADPLHATALTDSELVEELVSSAVSQLKGHFAVGGAQADGHAVLAAATGLAHRSGVQQSIDQVRS